VNRLKKVLDNYITNVIVAHVMLEVIRKIYEDTKLKYDITDDEVQNVLDQIYCDRIFK